MTADGGEFRVRPHATDDPEEREPVDIVFLGLKALSTLKRERCSAIERRRSPRRTVVLGGTSTGTEGRQRAAYRERRPRRRGVHGDRAGARSDAWCIARQRLRCRA